MNYGKKKIQHLDLEGRSKIAFFFADYMVTYLENIMEYRKKLLILICEFSKLARHKMNTQHSIVFLYTNNEKWEIKKNAKI